MSEVRQLCEGYVPVVPPTSAHVNITVAKNTTFSDAMQFGDEDDDTWNFENKTFRMALKGNLEQDDEVIAFTTAASEIVVDDTALRVLHFNVLPATLAAALIPGNYYFYTLLMSDTVTAVVTQLMHGVFNYADAV